MSGHSHYSNIKHKKEKKDKKRAKKFSKLSQQITTAAREGGGDPEKNSDLKSIIEKARNEDMPKENIERAIKKGTGELEGESIEKVMFGAYGPGGVAILLEGETDNRNRTLSEIKQVLKQNQGELAETSSVRWLFEQKGVVIIDTKNQDQEKLELEAIDAGADDIVTEEEQLKVYTTLEDLEQIKEKLGDYEVKSSGIKWVPKKEAEANEEEKEKVKELVEKLRDNSEIQSVYTNSSL
ncbi:MAG: YebC/PmpR family DNA-binding transcriptional regulator [Candidatus Paceibacterota bacterium]